MFSSTRMGTIMDIKGRGVRRDIENGKVCGSRTYKPNSVRLAAGRSFLWAAHCCAALATYPEVVTRRAGTCPDRGRGLPPYLVLLRVGFAMPVALLRRRCALTAPFHPYLAVVLSPSLRSRSVDQNFRQSKTSGLQRRRGGMFSVALSVDRA